LPSILGLLLSGSPPPGEAVVKPSYQDTANIPELTGSWHGAMGEHPVRKLSMPSPWPDYSANTERTYSLLWLMLVIINCDSIAHRETSLSFTLY